MILRISAQNDQKPSFLVNLIVSLTSSAESFRYSTSKLRLDLQLILSIFSLQTLNRSQFIDHLKEGVAKMQRELAVKERVNPIVDNLEMEWEETLVCEGCGKKTSSRKMEVGLFCSLDEDRSPTNLRELIESSVEPEKIDRNCEVNLSSDFRSLIA